MNLVLLLVPVALAYVIGSMPIGVLVAKWVSGRDVREIGSGKTGTTNVYRVTGKVGAVLTVLGDALKGILALWIARVFTAMVMGQAAYNWAPWVETMAGIATLVGHNWSIFLGFRGGAGTITTLGVIGAMNPWITAAEIGAAIIALSISRMASIASLTIAVTQGFVLLTFAILDKMPWPYAIFGFVGGMITIYALRTNIWRILKKQERRLKVNY